jgi:enoyl-CoA hydratase/carnithine racemase
MLDRIRHGEILQLHLARAPVNALNAELLVHLREAISAAPGDGVRALLISGGPNVFSAGLDVPHLLTLERDELEAAWREFFGVCEALARSPLPSVAAICGHSPAGGAVISLFCDYRLMARGPFRIGLNEVQVGLVVPECIQFALRRVIGTYRAERLLVSGAMIDAEQAHAIGMVDELTDVDHVVARGITWLEDLLKLPSKAMHATRRIARADLIENISDPSRLDLPRFLDEWYSDETQAVLHSLVARLKSKTG